MPRSTRIVTFPELVQAWIDTQPDVLSIPPQDPKLVYERTGMFGKEIVGIEFEVEVR